MSKSAYETYLRACREYLQLHRERGWKVEAEMLLRFWEEQGGMYKDIATHLRNEK